MMQDSNIVVVANSGATIFGSFQVKGKHLLTMAMSFIPQESKPNNVNHESFQSIASVFILKDKAWVDKGSGLVRFVFDLRTFQLRLVIRAGTPDEFECKLRPRIRAKGPRAYVVRVQAENGIGEHVLAIRFERDQDSRSFKKFVEKRGVDHNQKNNSNSNSKNPSSYPPSGNNNNNDNNKHFWTCSRCLQLVDSSLTSCHICGTFRQENSGMIDLTEHDISAIINDRYAEVTYSFHFRNRNKNVPSKELKFELTIDPDAFISKFKADIDGELFIGQTKERETASKEYDEAKKKDENAILISQPYKNIPNIFQIKTNIDSGSNIKLEITTEQYLKKKLNCFLKYCSMVISNLIFEPESIFVLI